MHADERHAQASRRLRLAAAALKVAEGRLDGALRLAREAGLSWREIGQAAGMTHEAARKRHNRGGT